MREEAEVGMSFRTVPAQPTAKVLIAAQSHDQLDAILVALDAVVASYNSPSRQDAGTTAASGSY